MAQDKEKRRAWREANREKANEHSRAWRAANREKSRASSRKWSAKHAERCRKYYERNKAKIAEKGRKYREENKARISERSRAYYKRNKTQIAYRFIEYKYGVSPIQWDAMLRNQLGRCGICCEPMRHPCLDHCHATKKPRGLVHMKCNVGLGKYERPGFLEQCAAYLANPPGIPVIDP